MGKLVTDTQDIINDIHNNIDLTLKEISEFNEAYDKYELLKTNYDVVYLKKIMKEKLLLGINCFEDSKDDN